jgi:hypothetical protein
MRCFKLNLERVAAGTTKLHFYETNRDHPMTILRQRYIAPNQDRALEVGIVLENRYRLRRVRYSTLREPRLIKFKFSERVVRGARAARPKRAPTVADVA